MCFLGHIMRIIRKFDCSCCGACCKNLDLITDLVPELADLCGPGGVCIYLDPETNLCTIYDKRPLCCRVDEQYDLHFKDKMSRSEYYKMQRELCKLLNNTDGN